MIQGENNKIVIILLISLVEKTRKEGKYFKFLFKNNRDSISNFKDDGDEEICGNGDRRRSETRRDGTAAVSLRRGRMATTTIDATTMTKTTESTNKNNIFGKVTKSLNFPCNFYGKRLKI